MKYSTINVRVKSIQQLFDLRDPSPFNERDLDPGFVQFIRSSAEDLPTSLPLQIKVTIEDESGDSLPPQSVHKAIQTYFAQEALQKRRELKRHARKAPIYLLIGAAVLLFSITLARNLEAKESNTALSILKEGLVIFGWVSLWKPMEFLLFDWNPIYDSMKLNRRLERAEVVIGPGLTQ